MKSGEGNKNNRSGTVGVSKGKSKRKKTVNNKPNRQSRNPDDRNGHNENDSSGSGRQWINGEDTMQNKTYKRSEKARRGHHTQDTADDRPFNVNSVPSTTHTSYSNNTSRKRKQYEEDKERWTNRTDSVPNYRSNDEWSEDESDTYWLREEDDDEKYTIEGIRSSNYENKNIYHFGLDLNDSSNYNNSKAGYYSRLDKPNDSNR